MAGRAQGGRGRADLLRPAGGVRRRRHRQPRHDWSPIIEELAWGCSAMAGCIGGGGFFAGPIVALGTPEQKERWLPPAVLADRPPSSARSRRPSRTPAPTPPRMTTSAAKVDGGYVLNGQKTWISCAPTADQYIVFAQTVPGSRSRGITAFLIVRGDEGFAIGKKMPKMGARVLPGCRAVLRRLLRGRRPPHRRRGPGLLRADARGSTCRASRSARTASASAARRSSTRSSTRKERAQFGKQIARVPGGLVPARGREDEARPGAAADVPRGRGWPIAGKPFAIEAATGQAGRVGGARGSRPGRRRRRSAATGYSREYPVERWLRAAKLEELYEGTSDIQRLIIASLACSSEAGATSRRC